MVIFGACSQMLWPFPPSGTRGLARQIRTAETGCLRTIHAAGSPEWQPAVRRHSRMRLRNTQARSRHRAGTLR